MSSSNIKQDNRFKKLVTPLVERTSPTKKPLLAQKRINSDSIILTSRRNSNYGQKNFRKCYCYADFMIRFTGHKGEKWGTFVDVKRYDMSRIRYSKYNGKRIFISSVTDPYQPVERKYENTRRLLESLIGTTAEITILTKSSLVQRDIDLFKQFNNISVGISMSTLDHDLAKQLEPKTSSPAARLEALEKIHDEGVSTFLFISPLFPEVTDFKKIISTSKSLVDVFMFENINIRPNNRQRVLNFIQSNRPDLTDYYKSLQGNVEEWDSLEHSIREYCSANGITPRIHFHHGGFSKKK